MPGRRTLSGLVVLGLLLATAFFTKVAYDNERDRADRANDELARQAALAVRQNVTVVGASLRGGSAIVGARGNVAPRKFRSFAASVLQNTGFLGLGWAPLVERGEHRAYERETGLQIKRLTPAGRFAELGRRDRDYLPLTLTFPRTRDRVRALGFDLLSDGPRTETVRDAIGSQVPRLTPPLRLAQTGGQGAVLYAPVVMLDPAGRRVAGVLSSAVTGGAIAEQLRRQVGTEGDVRITDGTRALGDADVQDPATAEIGVLGRRWTISVEGSADVSLAPEIAVASSGLALAFAAAGLFWVAARRERDLTRRRSSAELQAARESLLIRITEVMEREIEVDARLQSLARTLVPAVGDLCIVHEVTAEGEVRRVGVAAVDAALEDAVRELPEPPETSPIRAAISSREPVLYTRIAENREERRARERGIEVAPKELGPRARLEADVRSNLIVPLVARGKVLGTLAISVLRSTGRSPLTRDDVAFGMEVATHAAVALDNARLYEQQRDIAAILQRALLPRTLPEIDGVDVAVRHRAGKAGTEVGGDFYDLFEAGGRWMAVVGDVCGKGPEAASLTALVRHTLRATAQLGPEAAVRRVHEAIRSSGENTYCTLCCAELRTAPEGLIARVATAGHPEPRVVANDRTVTRLEVNGPLVGVLERPVFGAQEVRLEPGSMLFMCSDGVPEARRNGEVFGDDRLEALLQEVVSLEPPAALDRMEREVMEFSDGRRRDDLALFALKVRDRRSYESGRVGREQ